MVATQTTTRLGPGCGVHPSRAILAEPRPLALSRGLSPAEHLVALTDADPGAIIAHVLDAAGGCHTFTRAGLLHEAGRVAASLRDRGVGPGDRVLLCFDNEPDLLPAVYGAFLLGAVPSLAEPPIGGARVATWPDRVAFSCRVLEPRALYVRQGLRALAEQAGTGVAILEPSELGEAGPSHPFLRGADALAFIQFTSGTTARPRGVAVHLGALDANIRGIAAGSAYNAADMGVTWLPMHHDMGLVGYLIGGLCHGVPIVLMPPLAFLMRPERWLWAIHHFRGTCSGGPNFAFHLCAGRVPDARVTGLDLSSWRIAYNGAEFVHAATHRAFCDRYAAHGFREEAMLHCYGMAETVLAATFTPHDALPNRIVVDAAHLANHGRAVRVAADHPDAVELLSAGRPFAGHHLDVLDDAGAPVPEGTLGHLVLAGPSLAQGYFRDPAATEAAFPNGRHRTGDTGFLLGGELFVYGRSKELIVKGGSNYAPHAIESAAAQAPGVRADRLVAVGLPNQAAGTEDLVVVVETAEPAESCPALALAIGRALQQHAGLAVDAVVAVPAHSIPRTSSGKVQRARVRALLATRDLPHTWSNLGGPT